MTLPAPYYDEGGITIYHGDCLTVLRERFADESVQCCVTSPPYWGLRDYGVEGQLGLEKTPDEYVAKMVAVFREVRRVLKDDGTLWINLGDSYASVGKWGGSSGGKNDAAKKSGAYIRERKDWGDLKSKDMVGIPWMVAFALRADGWYLRSDIIWHKPNPMPESVTDRPTKAHEYLFLLTKSERYYYDHEAIKEPAIYAKEARYDPGTNGLGGGDRKTGKTTRMFAGTDKQRGHGRRHDGFNDRWDQMTKVEQCSGLRNKRSVWTVATQPYSEAHFATFPPKLIEPCILAGCPSGGLVLDPFAGSGTTIEVSQQLGRQGVGIDLNPDYFELANKRTAQRGLAL